MNSAMIDLRSDTVTRPTSGMRDAMAAAPVGDDQFGEDPTVNQLQERVAALLGKEAALWLPTGTMANQVALRVLTRPGDAVIISRGAHVMWHEMGGAGANAGVQLIEVGTGGLFMPGDVAAARVAPGHIATPATTLVAVENTHNRGGGVVFAADDAAQVCAMARETGMASFLDGARLWNASVATGIPVADLAAPFDVVSVALSKGLGAPGGSLLAGTRELMARALRYRRMSGGAMRQVGIFAAAGLYALDHHMHRLADDHANARLIAERLSRSAAIAIDLGTVQTNIVIFHLAPGAPDAAAMIAGAAARGILAFSFGPRTVRVVTHMDVSREQCTVAAETLVALGERRETAAPVVAADAG
jgi:threonine aldolase